MRLRELANIARRGNSAAALVCAVAVENGWDQAGWSDRDAEAWYRLAADNLPLAQLGLAKLLIDRKERLDEAVAWAKRAATAGLAEAATATGVLIEGGLGTTADPNAAARWYELGAQLGDPQAHVLLAGQYIDSSGKVRDAEKAARHLIEAVRMEYAPSKSLLALVYLQSADPQKEEEALKLLRDAAAEKDFGALLQLSEIYKFGLHGISQNRELAERYAREAIEAQRAALSDS
jgi:TPR repeat protein